MIKNNLFLSIFLFYSNDRLKEAQIAIDCLNECAGINSCQKILCCDGETNFRPKNFEVIEVERPPSGFYTWSDLWKFGVDCSNNSKIIYLDCDRILPKNALRIFNQYIDDNSFVFPKYHFKLNKKIDLDTARDIRCNIDNYRDILIEDHRVYQAENLNSPAWCSIRRKNPMSGCVGFTKKGFAISGGLDPNFYGWGYPDTDFFEKTYRMGFKFKSIDMNEIHLYHNISVTTRELKLMNLWNGIKFCKKWNYKIHENLIALSNELEINIDLLNFTKMDTNDFINFLNKYKNSRDHRVKNKYIL